MTTSQKSPRGRNSGAFTLCTCGYYILFSYRYYNICELLLQVFSICVFLFLFILVFFPISYLKNHSQKLIVEENFVIPDHVLKCFSMIPQVYIRINQKAQKMPPRVEPGGIFVIAARRRARPYYRRNTRLPRCTAGRARSDPPP